jgi:hypothetical protein
LWKSKDCFRVPKDGSAGGAYFEITVIELGETNIITLGICTTSYPLLGQQPGWRTGSVGYHGDDGNVY